MNNFNRKLDLVLSEATDPGPAAKKLYKHLLSIGAVKTCEKFRRTVDALWQSIQDGEVVIRSRRPNAENITLALGTLASHLTNTCICLRGLSNTSQPQMYIDHITEYSRAVESYFETGQIKNLHGGMVTAPISSIKRVLMGKACRVYPICQEVVSSFDEVMAVYPQIKIISQVVSNGLLGRPVYSAENDVADQADGMIAGEMPFL